MTDQADRTAGVSTTRTSFEILELLRDADGRSLADIRDEIGVAKSTAYRHLETLYRMGYLVEEDGEYRLSLRFLQLSEPPRLRKQGYLVARQKVIELAQATGERALFLVPERFEGVYVHRAGGRHPLQSDTMIGTRRPLHVLAAGKAILAEWSEARLEEYVAAVDLDSYTDNSITDPDRLRETLAAARSRGYATNVGEHMEGLRAAGVPVYDQHDDLLGGLSVFGPAARVETEDLESTYPALLEDAVQELRIDLTYD
ncbi:IclR family transcriptional regulator [Halanaeroarchaeum sp. HSR-CO]|uniref:IclR family transcriptional regulator n=1 Tax=Halanaeroarchaeum sp. HSR-CO TaxID=2866382 RepID=UPI00217E109A|nr:IclR family transcriptional regulator [Halanaeroarchaeum sp. HSR-CO]